MVGKLRQHVVPVALVLVAVQRKRGKAFPPQVAGQVRAGRPGVAEHQGGFGPKMAQQMRRGLEPPCVIDLVERSEEHTSELQSLMRISYAVFCLKQKNNIRNEQ